MAASQMDGYALTQVGYGVKSDKAAANLPQTATGTIFTVAGGRVIILALIGEVTTIIQAQANAVKFISTPTVGTAVDLCTTADINALEVGGRVALPGAVGSALTKANAGAIALQTANVLVPAGTIGLNTAASNTGQMKFTCWWIPFDSGATLS
jgi:hypothetical protein